MTEYIEREAALDICQKEYEDRLRMRDYCGDTVAWDICGAIKSLPAADVAPVVRCGECAKAIPHKYSPAFFKCGGCNYLRGRMVGRSFGCTAGKRKDGGEEDVAG